MDSCNLFAELPDPASCFGLTTSSSPQKIRYHANRSTAQTTACLDKWAQGICEMTGDIDHAPTASDISALTVWGESGREYYVEFLTSHLSSTGLRVMCFLHKLSPAQQGTSINMANALFNLRAPPIPAGDLRNWYGRYCILKLGGQDPGPGYQFVLSDPAPSGEDDSLREATENSLREAVHTSSRNRTGPGGGPPSPRPHRERDSSRGSARSSFSSDSPERNPDSDRRHSPNRSRSPRRSHERRHRSCSPDNLAKAILKAINQRPIGLEDGIKSGMCKFEDYMQKQQKLVDNRQIVEIAKLGGAYTNKLRGSTYHSKKVMLAPGIFFSTNDAIEQSSELGPNAWREGFDVFIRLHYESKNPIIRALATDRSLFNEQLWQLPIGSFAEKARFLEAFMARYYKEDRWVPFLYSDVVLNRILVTDTYGSLKSGQTGNVANDKKDNPKDRKQQDRDHDNKHNKHGGRDGRDGGRDGRDGRDGRVNQGPKEAKTSGKFCESRVNPSVGRCFKGKFCQLDHHCASCGGFHAASNCNNFDVAKAKANARSRN
jgi:hypothetical protein